MERPAILNRSMPSTAGATIGIPPGAQHVVCDNGQSETLETQNHSSEFLSTVSLMNAST
jgi:hypothetical protein